MAETISPYALTTLDRVKDRLQIAAATTTHDEELTRMINSITDWFERETGNRRFVLTKYANEIYSAYGPRQKRVVTRQAPIYQLNVTGNMTSGSASITGVSDTTGMVVGMPILADNFPSSTVISSISGATVVMSKSATATENTAYFLVSGLTDFQWRAGTPSNPSWQDFLIDQYEVVNDGKAGVIRIYGVIPRLYNNMIRMTYYAGYAVNWANFGDNITHKLPSDITDTAENLVIRRFKRRTIPGKSSESLEGSTVSWNKEIDSEDQAVIDHYRRMPTIF